MELDYCRPIRARERSQKVCTTKKLAENVKRITTTTTICETPNYAQSLANRPRLWSFVKTWYSEKVLCQLQPPPTDQMAAMSVSSQQKTTSSTKSPPPSSSSSSSSVTASKQVDFAWTCRKNHEWCHSTVVWGLPSSCVVDLNPYQLSCPGSSVGRALA